MVYGTVSDIVFIHHVHDTHDRFGVMGSVAIHLYVEDMAANESNHDKELLLLLYDGHCTYNIPERD